MKEISKKVLEAVKETAKDGRITCVQAHKVAQEMGVPLLVIGAAADELGLKIISCQLGCF